MRLYLAYGSNLCKAQMKIRCPDAVALGAMVLDDWKLVFRGVADIIPSPGEKVQAGVWAVSERDEAALDAYEGIGAGLYRREFIQIDPFKFRGKVHTEMLVYVMNSTGIMPPSRSYLDVIRRGFKDFGLKTKSLDKAVAHSHDDKAPSHIERQRHMRKGRPALAPHPHASKPARKRTNEKAAPTNAQLSLWNAAMTVHSQD